MTTAQTAPPKLVKLQLLVDDTTIEVPADIARKSAIVATMMDDLICCTDEAGVENPLPIPHVSRVILLKVFEYCKYHHENPDGSTEEQRQQRRKERRLDDISEWDAEFCDVADEETVFLLLEAANFLEIPALLDLATKTVAIILRGMTPEQICQKYGITEEWVEGDAEVERVIPDTKAKDLRERYYKPADWPLSERALLKEENAWCEPANAN